MVYRISGQRQTVLGVPEGRYQVVYALDDFQDNRRAFDDIFENELKNEKRHGELFSILLIDIDHFKHHNDTLGHNIGDEILNEVVKVITLHIRQVDYLFRWGGDEFVILLPKTAIKGAQMIAERIRYAIENWKFPYSVKITISIGLSLFQANDTAHSLIQRADTALYRSKEAGRNCISNPIK